MQVAEWVQFEVRVKVHTWAYKVQCHQHNVLQQADPPNWPVTITMVTVTTVTATYESSNQYSPKGT